MSRIASGFSAGNRQPNPMSSQPQTPRAVLAVAVLLGLVAVVSLVFVVTISRERGFQPDEAEHLHAAYELASGNVIYRDFTQSHNPLLHLLLAPLIDVDDPAASYARGRWLALVGLFLTLVVVAWLGQRLYGAEAGVLAPGLLLVHTTFVERGMEVRPDIWLGLGAVAALALEVSPARRLVRSMLQALILALTFLFSQKIAFVCVFFGIVWLLDAIETRRWQHVVVPMIVWSLPIAALLGVMLGVGALEPYLDTNVRAPLASLSGTATHGATFGPSLYLWREGLNNPVFSLAVLPALVACLVPLPSLEPVQRFGSRLTAGLGGLLLTSVWLHPYPYPYLHVTVLPVLAVAVALMSTRVLRRAFAGSLTRLLAVLVILGSSLAFATPRFLEVLRMDQESMRVNLEIIHAITAPDDAVFDMSGMAFRPNAFDPYWMTAPMIRNYEAGKYPRMVDEWRRREMVAGVLSYRTDWLGENETQFLASHFVPFDRNVYIHGTRVDLAADTSQTFEVLKEHDFVFRGEGGLVVDGTPFQRGILTKGVHELTTSTPSTRGWLLFDSERPRPDVPAPPDPLFILFG